MRYLRILPLLAFFVLASQGFAASEIEGTYTGEHPVNNDKLLCELTITKKGQEYAIFGSYALASGQGANPTLEGVGTVNYKGVLIARFTDTFDNSGSATITPTDDGVTIAIKVSDVKDPRCIPLYKDMTLKRQ